MCTSKYLLGKLFNEGLSIWLSHQFDYKWIVWVHLNKATDSFKIYFSELSCCLHTVERFLLKGWSHKTHFLHSTTLLLHYVNPHYMDSFNHCICISCLLLLLALDTVLKFKEVRLLKNTSLDQWWGHIRARVALAHPDWWLAHPIKAARIYY